MRSQMRSTQPMHELAVCQSVLRQVVAIAAERNASRVGRITLRIGPLAGVEPSLIGLAFPIVAAGTLCDASALEIESVPVRVRCRICAASSEVPVNRLLCARCDSWNVELTSGDELVLALVELLDAEDGGDDV